MSLNKRIHLNSMEALVLLTIFIGGAFSYYQVGSRLFACEMDLAGSEIRCLMRLSNILDALRVNNINHELNLNAKGGLHES